MRSSNTFRHLARATPAAASIAGLGSSADAVIVHFDIDSGLTSSTVYNTETYDWDVTIGFIGDINLETGTYQLGSSNDIGFRGTFENGGDPEKPTLFTTSSLKMLQSETFGEGYLAALQAGTVISDSPAFGTGNNLHLEDDSEGDWADGLDAFVGLRIVSGDSDYNYGWLHIIYDDDGDAFTFTDFAFETELNTAILAGATTSAVPEPRHAALLLAAGAAGVAAYRRKKATKPA